MSDWLTVFSIVVAWILGASTVLMAQNLRSRRKRPGPQEAELDDKRYALLDGAVVRLREVYPGDYKLFRLTNLSHPLHWDEIVPSPPPSPPSSQATGTSEAIGPGSDGSSRS